MVKLTIDDLEVEAAEEETILAAARRADIYIPALCAHPDLSPAPGRKASKAVFINGELSEGTNEGKEFEGCRLCVVQIEGRPGSHLSCNTPVAEGMIVHTNTSELQGVRRDELAKILAKHPHACLICPHREGCSLTQCSSNVPEEERCCPKFNSCELRKVAEYIGMRTDIPRYTFRNLPIIKDAPLFFHDYNLCIGCLRCVRICRDIRGADAIDFIYRDNEVLVGTTAPSREEAGCRFCTACVEVCPTGALRDKEEFEEAPCKISCPAEIDVPQYVHLINEGKFAEASAVIREKVPFPRVLGYICPHDCELKCRRREINEPIAIRVLKRFAAEHDDKRWRERLKPTTPTGKKVAIIGSGPAGLATAYYLTRLGHSVTIFETASMPGGMMQTGIPRFLLPQEVLDQEIEEILSFGIELKLNSRVEDIGQLLHEGYDAALVAIGLQEGRKLPIPGNDLEGVLIGLDLLRDVSEGKEINLGQNVLVLGGGGVACDVSRTARRLGTPQVAMACLESRETVPAPEQDIRQVEEEGIKIFPCRSFKQILRDNGRVKGIECLEVKWMKFDEKGRLQLETFPGSEHTLEADTVIFAIGQALNREFVERNKLKLTGRGTFEASPDTLETNTKGIFVAGDAITGPASVVEAVATGRRASISIDKYLGGQGILEEKLSEEKEISPYLGREESFAKKARVEPLFLSIEERVRSFGGVELTLSPEQAVTEAGRCLRCDLRLQISAPLLPPEEWLEFEAKNVEPVPAVEGVYQLLDESKNIIYIKGAMNMRQELEEELASNEKARYFSWEEEPMYTRRESELLQQFLQQHGQLPSQNLGLEDLFD